MTDSSSAPPPALEIPESALRSLVDHFWKRDCARMRPMWSVASSLVLVLCAIGSAWGADPPTLEELAAGIEKVRSGRDGERVVVGHISRKLELSVDSLRTQQARTTLSWGDLFIANLLSKGTKVSVDALAAELKSGTQWEDIARRHNARLDELIAEVRLSQQAMEQRAEDRAPPRTESPASQGSAPTSVVPLPNTGGSGRRY